MTKPKFCKGQVVIEKDSGEPLKISTVYPPTEDSTAQYAGRGLLLYGERSLRALTKKEAGR